MTRNFRWLRSLPAQLVGLLSLALLPLGLISFVQTRQVLSDAKDVHRNALTGLTVEAAMGERAFIHEALGVAQGLATVLEAAPTTRCGAMLGSFVDTHMQFVFAGYTDRTGTLLCSSNGATGAFSEPSALEQALEREMGFVEFMLEEPAIGRDVVVVGQPVRVEGALAGMMVVAIPHSLASSQVSETENGLRLATVNRDGVLIAASGGREIAAGFLPRDITLRDVAGRSGETFDAVAGDGSDRVFAVSDLVPESVALIGSWPPGAMAQNGQSVRGFLHIGFPVLMWFVGIGVAFFGVQRLVIRHIGDLRSAMRKYALGDLRGGRLELDKPPEELKDTERAFNRMILFLAQAQAQQEQDLRDKEVLLKEVHHRVKNNLQLIASIMNMQARTAKTSEARAMLAGLQRRVRGLAILHRTLYTTPDTSSIDAADMTRALVKDLVDGVGTASRAIGIKTDLEPLELFPDQAVPLSMLLAETLTNALKNCGIPEDGGEPWIAVTLSHDDEKTVRLTIENSRGEPVSASQAGDGEHTGLGRRLISAFVAQLEGTYDVEETPERYRFRLSFETREFTPMRPAEEA